MITISPIKYNLSQNANLYQRANNSSNINTSGIYSNRINFGNKVKNTTMADHFEATHIQEIERRYRRLSNTFLANLRQVADDVKGVKYDHVYNSKAPIKSSKSILSKIRRKDEQVSDQIRGTLFVENPYDLNILKNVLKKLDENFGYVLAPHPVKRGLKDLDIRLDKEELLNENVDYLKVIKELKGEYSGPQKSGYEDIQLRLIRSHEPNKNDKQKIPHELIILFGENYAKAKQLDSDLIYGNLRQFDELMIAGLSEQSENSMRAKRYIKLIKSMFQGKFADKLFINAKNKDYKFGVNTNIPIKFEETDRQLLDGYFAGFLDRLLKYYKPKKNITKQESVQLQSLKQADIKKFNDIKQGLNKAVDFLTNDSNLK